MVFDWDDLWPGQTNLDLFHRLHENRPDFRCTVFAAPGRGNDRFWDSLPEWMEVAVHGYMHPDPRECEAWTADRMRRAIAEKPDRFVEGFKAPGWQISNGCYEALLEADWWVADHPENDGRRPDGLRVHVVGGPDHWHGHIPDVCGNGIQETWDIVEQLVYEAESFEFMSETIVAVAA